MKVKIAHCADIHLKINSKNNGFEEKEAFSCLLKTCKDEKVDILLICGDLFDDITDEKPDINFIKDELENFAIKTVISPGNHDPFTSDCPYSFEKWPENVYIFKENTLNYIEFPDLNLRVWGAAFKSIYQKSTLFTGFKNFDDHFINICAIHGNITSSELDYYNPINLKDIEKSGMQYVALGHIHKKSKINKAGKTFYSYCGSLLSKGFGDTGEKGIYIGEISKETCSFKFKKIYKRSYEKISVDVSNLINNKAIADLILEKIKSNYKKGFENNLYEVTLLGDLDEDFKLDLEYINLSLAREVFFIKIFDKTETKIDTDNLKFRNDFKSVFIKQALKLIDSCENEEEKALNKNALKLGLKAFTEDVFYRDN